MPKTIAILGAGPGTGLGVARRFGAEGYQVALVARRQPPLEELVTTLEGEGITAASFPADLTELESLPALFEAIEGRLGAVDALCFSPSPSEGFTPAAEITAGQFKQFNEVAFYPLVEAVRAVLPGMLARGEGAVMYVAGASAVGAPANLSGPGPVAAAARNYLETLRAEVADKGVAVTAAFISAFIEDSAAFAKSTDFIEAHGIPTIRPEVIADALWALVQDRSDFEVLLPGPMMGI